LFLIKLYKSFFISFFHIKFKAGKTINNIKNEYVIDNWKLKKIERPIIVVEKRTDAIKKINKNILFVEIKSLNVSLLTYLNGIVTHILEKMIAMHIP
jgi:hypothetical protein